MDSNAKVQRYLADLNSPTTSPTSPNEGKLKGFRGPGQAAHDPLQFVAPPSTANLAERAKKLVTLTEEQKRIREIELDAAPRKMNEEESWQADLDTWRKKRKNRLSSEEPTDKGYGSGTSQPENDYRITPSLKTVEQSEIHDYNSFNYTKQTSNEDYSRSGYGSLEKHMYSMSTANQEDRKPTNGDLGYGNTDSTDEHDYEILRTAEELPYTKQQNVTEVRYSYSERHDPESVQYPTSENYGSRDQRNRYEDYSSRTGNYGNEEKKYGTNVESIISHYKPMKQFDDYEKINISKSQTDEEFIRNKYGMENKQAVTGDAKEEILTITSPSGDDSGIENRNSSSQSPSTSFDFSPRSADPISPKGQQFHPARSSSPTAPNYAPPPPPTSELDQVLIPVSTSHISRSIPKDEPVDYPPPPEHLRTPSSERKTFGTHSEEILSPNRARAFASFPAASSLREHTKVEPFVAQSIRDHNQSGEKSVELTVELNREQKAVVSATKFPGRREKYTPSSEEESTEEKPDSPVEARQSRQTSRDTYSSYSSKPVASVRSSIQSRTISSDSSKYQPLSRLSQSVSTPNVAAPLPSQPSNMSTTVYRAVDIPFDDSAATYQPPRMNKDGLVCMVIEMGAQPVHKGFGFTINCERRKCLVDGVIVGTPADKHGLLIGDRIDSINGESVADKYPSAINRMLHESARLGEVQLMIQRKDVRLLYGSTPNLNAPRTTGSKFDETRNVFKEKPESYSEFKRKHTKARNEPHPLPRDFNSLPRSSSSSTTQYDSLPRRRDASANSSYRTARQSFESLQSAHTGPDYRVSSLHEKSGPGKLTDFVPEVERKKEETYSSRRSYGSSEEPRTIRNYEVLPPRHETSNTKVFKSASTASTDSSTTLAMPTRSTLPRKSSSHHEEQHADDDTVPGKSYLESRDWRDVINQQRQPAPGQKTDTQRIKEVTASMSNLPSIMDRKQEEIRKLQRENADYQYKSYDRKNEQPHQVYERTEYGIYEKRFSPEPYTPQHYNSLKYSEPLADKKNNYASNYEDKATSYNDYRRNYGSEPRKEHTFNQQASNYRDQSTVHREQSSYATKQREQSNYKEQSMISEQSSKVKEEIKREPENKESVVAISGKHKCAHCGEELGRGAAMIVESLGLYYHLACFKCYVCKTPLGSGTTGADVRVREGRLHCQSCYSNDRLQLSKV